MKKMESDTAPEDKRIRAFFALLAILLVIIGQTLLYTSPVRQETGIPAALWLCVLGVIMFLGSLALRPPRFLQSLFAKLPSTGLALGVSVAVTLSILTTVSMVLFQRIGNINYLPVIFLWLASAICYTAAFSGGIVLNFPWRMWLVTHRNELITIGVVTLLGFLFRFHRLGEIPRVINGDEGLLGLVAESTIRDPLTNPFTLWNNLSAFYLQAVNVIIRLFGATSFSLRLLSAIGGVLAIPALYLFARWVDGKRVAFISAFLLAISHFHINFSRTSGGDYVQTTWLAPLVFYFLLSGFEKRRAWRVALAGVLLGIYFTIFQPAQIVVAVAAAYMLVASLFFRGWFKTMGKQILIFWGGFATILLPEAFFIWKHPNEFLSRFGASGTFQTGWLSQTMANTGQSAIQILADRIVHAFLSLIYYPSLDYYGSPVPPLTLISATLFLIGLGISLWRTRSPGYLLLNGYFWGSTLAIGIFAIPPSADTYRMLIVLPAACMMAAMGLDQILEAVDLGWESARTKYAVATAITLIGLSAINLWSYYGEFAARCLYADNMPGRFASYLGSYAGTIRLEQNIYLLSDDLYFYGSHDSAIFLSRGRKIVNVGDPVDVLNAMAGDVIISNPNRFEELKTWADANPGGELRYFYDCANLIMMAYHFP